MGSTLRPLTLKPPMISGTTERRGFLRNLIQALSTLGCRHVHQSVASRKLSSATYEMFVICTACQKRISPGVLLGKGSEEYGASNISEQAPEIAATPSLAH
jgi:hypothetical protein